MEEGSRTTDGSADDPLLRIRREDIAARGFEDETVVLDLRSSTYMSTNPAGTVIWRRLQDGATRQQLIDALLDEFEVGADRAGTDVDAFLAECRRRGLLSGEHAADDTDPR